MIGSAPPFMAESLWTSDIVQAAHHRADWELVRGVYEQCAAIADDRDARFMPDDLVGYLAEAFGRVAANYHGDEERFVLHAFAVLANGMGVEELTPALFETLYREERFDRFKQYGITDADESTRRRPRPFETLVETSRRFRDVNAIAALLGPTTSGILGGSTSYGRFFNVAGRSGLTESSDLDLLVIVQRFEALGDVLERLEAVDGLSVHELEWAARRAEIFARQEWDDRRTIFSHKVSMWSEERDPLLAWGKEDGTYAVSIHVLSRAVLDQLLVSDVPKLHENDAGASRSIRDYRERPSGPYDIQRSFSGKYRRVDTMSREVDQGFLRRSGVFAINDGRYFPGMFQNLIFPRFGVRWDHLGVRGTLEAFRYKLIERLRYERTQRPYEMLRLSLAHTRTEVFAPNVLERIDGGGQQP